MNDNPSPSKRRISPSVDRALSVLLLLADHPDGMGVSEISRRLGVAKSSLHVVLSTMEQRGFIVKDPGTKRYTLGPQLLVLGSAYARQINLLTDFQPLAAKLAEDCGETVQLAILRGRNILYLGKQEGTQPVRLACQVGGQLPAHATALGKSLLAGLPEEAVDELYAGVSLEKRTSQTIDNLDDLKRDLAAVRARGYAVDRGETLEDLRCVAAPVYDAQGSVVAAVSVSVPITRMDDERESRLAQKVTGLAQELSRRLGYAAPSASLGAA